MREIKFRTWDSITDQMDYYPRLSMAHHVRLLLNEEIREFQSIGHEFMQYTGLKDKNGKEIYEGDIVTWSAWRYHPNGNPRGVIKYHDGAFVIGEDMELLHTLYPTTEVIGNIYEHSSLLTKTSHHHDNA